MQSIIMMNIINLIMLLVVVKINFTNYNKVELIEVNGLVRSVLINRIHYLNIVAFVMLIIQIGSTLYFIGKEFLLCTWLTVEFLIIFVLLIDAHLIKIITELKNPPDVILKPA